MKKIGIVEGLWRYPVKSMRGEELDQAFVGFGGVYGDRAYALLSTGNTKGFPYFTAREKAAMLLYSPEYRNFGRMLQPLNLGEAEALGSGVTPIYADGEEMMADVLTPSGESLPIDDPRLLASLHQDLEEKHQLTLRQSHRAMTDCRPISIFSTQTAQQLGKEVGVDLDVRRFRANIYLDMEGAAGFSEDALVGRTLRVGPQAVISVINRDGRCKMITLDPDTGEANPEIMKVLAREHEGKAGLYAAVLVEGTITPGDTVMLLD